MSEKLERLANTPKSFTVKDKVYKVKQLSILQIAEIRQEIIEELKSEYKKDISDLVASLPSKERVNYMIEALKSFRAEEDSINQYLSSRKGATITLSKALDEDTDKVVDYLKNPELQESMWEIYTFCMGVDSDNSDNSDEQEDSEKDNGDKKN